MVDYENGKIPPSLLRRVSNFRPLYSGVTSAAGSDLLREDAWAALNILQAEFYKRFERPLDVSEAYRGLTRQTAVWRDYKYGNGPMAAEVGHSNHGWAVACDFASEVNTYGSATKYWMDRNAPRWGWHPVGNGFPKPEAWHFEFKPGTATEIIPASSGATPFPTTPTTPEDEDDMFTDADRANLANALAILAKDNVATEEGGIRGALDRAYVREQRPRPEAQHRLVRLKGYNEVFHSVDFHTMRWVKTEADLAALGWQLQQINALTTASIVSQVLEVGTLTPFGTILGARPTDSAGKVVAAYANL